jgi:hypothetical protein
MDEILWELRDHDAALEDDCPVTPELYRELRGQELEALGGAGKGRLSQAAEILDGLVLITLGKMGRVCAASPWHPRW